VEGCTKSALAVMAGALYVTDSVTRLQLVWLLLQVPASQFRLGSRPTQVLALRLSERT
jgi:hypothetical protein